MKKTSNVKADPLKGRRPTHVLTSHRTAIDGEERTFKSNYLLRILGVIMILHVIVFGGIYIHKIFGPNPEVKQTSKKATGTEKKSKPQAAKPAVAEKPVVVQNPKENLPVQTEPEPKSGNPAVNAEANSPQNHPKPPIPGKPIKSRIPIGGIRHLVTSGQTWESIARENCCTVEHLKKHNPNVKQLRASIMLTIMPNPGDYSQEEIDKVAQQTKPAYSGTTYKVVKGDTLSSIAKKCNVSLSELQKINNIKDPRKIQIGQTLKLPKP